MPIWGVIHCELQTGGGLPPSGTRNITVPRVPVPNAVKTALFLRINEFYRPCRRTRSNGCLGFLESPTSTFSFLAFILSRIHTIQVNLLLLR